MYKKAWCTCKVVVLLIETYCFFAALVAVASSLLKLPIVVIQKFCNHGNVTSQLCSLLRPFTIAKDDFFYESWEKGWLTGLLPSCNYQTNHLYHPSAICNEKNANRWLIVLWLLCFRGLRKLMFQYFTFGVGEYYRGIVKSAQVKQLQRYVPSLKVEDVERWGTLWYVSIKMSLGLWGTWRWDQIFWNHA